MNPKNVGDPVGDDSLGVLDDAASLDTTGIGILGGTAQVNVALPQEEDDDLVDDGIVDDEIVIDLIVDDVRPVDAAPIGRITATDIVIEIPAEPVERASEKASAPVEAAQIAVSKPAPKTKSVNGTKAPKTKPPKATKAKAAKNEPVAVDAAAEPVPATIDAVPATIDEPVTIVEPAVIVEPVEIVAPAVIKEPAVIAEPAAGIEPIADPRPEIGIAPKPSSRVEDEAAAARAFLVRARADIEAANASMAAAVPARVQKETPAVETPTEKSVVEQPSRAARTDVALTSKRLDELGDTARESADLLTADRLLDPHRLTKPEPEGTWSHFLYTVSGRRINIGDGKRARDRKALIARIAAPLAGGARFVPVLSRKGGVGKTTITALLGMALADAREDRVIAVDANPDRGTLAERVVRPHHTKSVRDLVRIHDDVKGYHDISAIVARDATRLDVLASDSDPRIAEAFSDSDYRDVAGVAAHYYSLVLTDTGTGIVHSVMSATLDLSDQIVIVSGLSVDEARLASETLTWLESNGYEDQARDAIVVLNQATPGKPLVRLNELEAHFSTRARKVVRMPYDPQIAGGGTIVFTHLLPETRTAARELAAALVEGLRAQAA